MTFRDPVDYPKGNHMITLLETNVVTFVKGGLASKNLEYWNFVPGVARTTAWVGNLERSGTARESVTLASTACRRLRLAIASATGPSRPPGSDQSRS